MAPSELIPRTTVDEVVGHRDRALNLYARAFEKIEEAARAIAEADSAVRDACGGLSSEPYVEKHASEVEAFRNAVKLPDGDEYLRVARRLTDLKVWASLIERTDLETLMDKEAKDQLRGQMAYVPEKTDGDGLVINQEEIERGLPPVTVETVRSTLEGFAADSETIFRRGLANAFAKLDRRFRSHDGFKIGSRVILYRTFDEWGTWNYYRGHRDTLTDIERVFLVLDGKAPRANYAGIVGAIDEERKKEHNFVRRQSEVEGDYFRVRIFKNGNAHLWFTRKDLLSKVNQILADHYGEVLGDGPGRADEEPDPMEGRKLTPARRFGFFPTPEEIVWKVLDQCLVLVDHQAQPLRVLEPSAGTGNLARPLAEAGARVTAVEIQPELVAKMRQEIPQLRRVLVGDFLQLDQKHVGEFDLVVMNPPFDRERDVDHVSHAWKFLRPGGSLVAIMSAGTEWRETKKARAFRELMKKNGARWFDLPMGAFREVGTEVSTTLLRVTKKG